MECLTKQGYPPLSPPTSEQQYVNEYATGKAPSWYAYQALGEAPAPGTMEKLEKLCPQPSVDK